MERENIIDPLPEFRFKPEEESTAPEPAEEAQAFFDTQRERMEKGEMPPFWDLVSRFEIPDFPTDRPELSGFADELRTRRIEADIGKRSFVNELQQMQERGAGEQEVLGKILERFYAETPYRLRSNGVVNIFAPERGKKPQANCEGRAKGISVILEELGYDPESEVLMEAFSDHVRSVVLAKDGKRYVLEGGTPQEWKSTEGTTVTSANDVKRTLVGLAPKSIEDFRLGDKSFHGSAPSRLLLMPRETRALSFQGDRAYGGPVSDARLSLPIPAVLQKMSVLISAHVERIAAGLKERSGPLSALLPSMKRTAKTVSAALFLGYGVDRAPEALEQVQATSPEAIASAIEEEVKSIEVAAEEAVGAVRQALEELMKSKEEKGEPQLVVGDGGLESNLPTAQTEAGGEALIVEFVERLPDTLEEHWRTHFDQIDFLVREGETDRGIEYAMSPEGGTDYSHLTIRPNGLEQTVSPSFWEYVLQEMARSASEARSGHFPSEMTIDFRVSDPTHFQAIGPGVLEGVSFGDRDGLPVYDRISHIQEIFGSNTSLPVLLRIMVNGSEVYRIRNDFGLDQNSIGAEEVYLDQIEKQLQKQGEIQDLLSGVAPISTDRPPSWVEHARRSLIQNFLRYAIMRYEINRGELSGESDEERKMKKGEIEQRLERFLASEFLLFKAERDYHDSHYRRAIEEALLTEKSQAVK